MSVAAIDNDAAPELPKGVIQVNEFFSILKPSPLDSFYEVTLPEIDLPDGREYEELLVVGYGNRLSEADGYVWMPMSRDTAVSGDDNRVTKLQLNSVPGVMFIGMLAESKVSNKTYNSHQDTIKALKNR